MTDTTPATLNDGGGQFSRTVTILIAVASTVIAATGVRALSQLLSATFLALVLVIVVYPVRRRLEARGVSKKLAGASVAICAFGILLTVALSVVLAVVRFVDYARTSDYEASLADAQDDLTSLLDRLGIEGDDLSKALDGIDLGALAGHVASSLSGVIGSVGLIGTAVMIVFFLTIDSSSFLMSLSSTVNRHQPTLVQALNGFAANTRQYFVVNTIFGLLVALVDTALLLALGVPLALVWGVLSFFSSFIPNVGFILGLIPPAILALVAISPTAAVVVIVAYIVINFIVDSIIKPRFVGDAVGLSTTLTFLSLLFWSWVFGALGAVLAIPLTLFVRAILIDSDPAKQWMLSVVAGADGPDSATTDSTATDSTATDSATTDGGAA